MADVTYRVWFELDPPLPPWYWWLVEHRLTWPTQRMWLGKAERGVRQVAASQGMTLIGDPIGAVDIRDGLFVVHASAIASGPDDPGAPNDHGPVDIVDRRKGTSR